MPAERPYLVKNPQDLRNPEGERIAPEPVFALCRCGGSAKKPFCDARWSVGFKDPAG